MANRHATEMRRSDQVDVEDLTPRGIPCLVGLVEFEVDADGRVVDENVDAAAPRDRSLPQTSQVAEIREFGLDRQASLRPEPGRYFLSGGDAAAIVKHDV